MCRIVQTLIATLLISSMIDAQVSFQELIIAEPISYGYSLAELPDSSVMLGMAHIEEFGSDYRLAIVKTDHLGEIQWSKHFLPGTPFAIPSILPVSSGGVLILSELDAPQALYAIRMTSDGDTLWTKTYPTQGPSMAAKAVESSDGGFVISCNSFNRHAISKIDENGNMIWSEIYSGDIIPEGNVFDFRTDVIETYDGGFASVSFGYSDTIPNSNASIIKVDENGVPQWNRIVGAEAQECYRSIVELDDNGLLAVGYTKSFGSEDVLLSKFSDEGELLWSKTFDSGEDDHIMNMHRLQDGNITLTGYARDSTSLPAYGMIINIQDDGELNWSSRIDNTYRIYGSDTTYDKGILLTGSNRISGSEFSSFLLRADSMGIAGCGHSELSLSEEPRTLTSAASNSLGISIGESVVSISEILDYEYTVIPVCDTVITHIPVYQYDSDIKVYQVDDSRTLMIVSSTVNSSQLEIVLFSSQGKLISSERWADQPVKEITLPNILPGMYFYHIISTEPRFHSGKILIR